MSMKRKLRSGAGETIGEVLVALLISAAALVMLAAMVASSARMTEQSEARLSAYYAENVRLDQQTGTSETVTVTIRDGAAALRLSDGTLQVKVYTNAAAPDVMAYQVK